MLQLIVQEDSLHGSCLLKQHFDFCVNIAEFFIMKTKSIVVFIMDILEHVQIVIQIILRISLLDKATANGT